MEWNTTYFTAFGHFHKTQLVNTMGFSPFVRNMLSIVGVSTIALVYLSYREETASVWTTTGYVRSATTTDTDSYETPKYEEPTAAPTKPTEPWPKLNDLLSSNGKSITADVQSILDFAIIGRKCPVVASQFSDRHPHLDRS